MNQVSNLKLPIHPNIKKILQVTVKATREILNCDRVLAYDTVSLPQAEVVAESVAPQYASIIGQTIKDPFLQGDYLEMYCYGMSLTIDNIYTSNISPKDLIDLEKIKVKSVAIAPISVNNKLLAFLVAHRCSQFQPWDLEVANFLAEQTHNIETAIADIIKSKTADRTTQTTIDDLGKPTVTVTDLEKQLQNVTDTSQNPNYLDSCGADKILTELQNQINDKLEPEKIFHQTVTQVMRLLQSDRVFIAIFEPSDCGVVVAEAVAHGWSKALNTALSSFSFIQRQKHNSEQEAVCVWNSPDDAYGKDDWLCCLEQLETLEAKAGIAVPIMGKNQLFGLLIVHQCSDTRQWQKPEINWITKIANQLDTMFEYINISKDNQHEEQLADVQRQLVKERMWTKHLADVIQKIRQSLDTDYILKTTVQEAHNILECDRVLVYGLTENSYGAIIAESVSPGWTRGEGRVIKDPCFEARYLEKYRDGRIRAWNNIYQSGMSDCYIEQLETLEVKANLVVPIIKEDQLFGLLVAHQCSDTRQWQQSEILWFTQVATQVGFALDNAQLIADAQQLRQQAQERKSWTEYFSDALQQIRQSLKTQDVLQASVREVRRVLNCDRVVVYALNQDNYGMIVAESVAHGWTRSQGKIIKDPCFEARYLESYRDGRVRAWSNIHEAGMSSCYIEQLEKLEIKANVVTPIINQGKLFGLLVAHQCSDTRQWQDAEINWLTQIAVQVGFAVDNAQMLQQIEQNTRETQEILNRAINSSSHIQNTVENVIRGFENLGNSCQQFGETIQQIKHISKQLAQQSMNMTRILNLAQAEANQNFAVDQSDRVFSLMQELFETTAQIEPLFNNIKTEIKEKTLTLDSETQKLVRGIGDFQLASDKLDQVVNLNYEMGNLVENISHSLETQIQSSSFTQDSIGELADITERISQQSIAIINSFNQLALLFR